MVTIRVRAESAFDAVQDLLAPGETKDFTPAEAEGLLALVDAHGSPLCERVESSQSTTGGDSGDADN